jgi:cytoskeletal protein CcmA (bactofilin family)
MTDTQVKNKLFENMPVEDAPALTDSQVIPFKNVPDSVKSEPFDSVKSEPTFGAGDVSVIGESLYFKGELSAGEDLIIEGTVEGTINQGRCCLTLKPNGRLIANVNATKIFVEGDVKGDLHATVSVSVRESATVKGNIVAPKVSIEEGATFNGNIEMRMPSDPAAKR